MIKRRHVVVILCSAAALLFAACKSTPKAEEKKTTPAPTEETKTPDKTPETKNDYSEANAALLKKVEDARSAALAAGADSVNQAGYGAAEAEYETEKAAVASSTADLSVALNDLIARYNALSSYAQAKAKKDRIDSLSFAGYDQSDYDSASKTLDELSQPTANVAKGTDLYEKADSADKGFAAVLTAGFRSLAKTARTQANDAKKQADSVKAVVSHKDEYYAALTRFNNGDKSYLTGDPESSVTEYNASKDSFTTLYTTISEARAKAQAAIDAAKKSVSDSNSVATQADTVAPLGNEKVQGIEDPDTKLLQDDDYSSNEQAATVDETLTEEGATEK